MIYDGDCDFCRFWIHRWQRATAGRVEYLAFQDPRIAAQFSEIPRVQFESAVQLVEPSGAVYQSAEAVFRSLAFNPYRQRWLRYYERLPLFARFAEWSYRMVFRQRKFLFFLTRVLWRVPKKGE
jgi:lipase maturation factor 1